MLHFKKLELFTTEDWMAVLAYAIYIIIIGGTLAIQVLTWMMQHIVIH